MGVLFYIFKGVDKVDFAHEIARSQMVWTILCIIWAAAVIQEMRKEDVEREKKSGRSLRGLSFGIKRARSLVVEAFRVVE